MDIMTARMATISNEMSLVQQAMANMDPRLNQMSSGVSIMRVNTLQLSAPMGMMNSIMP